MKIKNHLSRRNFIKNTASAGLALNIVPAYVLGSASRVAPSDKINVALIGSGTQALDLLPGWLNRPELQFVSVCDPNRMSYDYPRWGEPSGETCGSQGGREVGRHVINKYYAEKLGNEKYDGCTTYADFRELLEKENGIDAVFIMTPDHNHATIAIAAMKKKIMVGSHKPIGNFMHETRVTIETARKTSVPTQMFAFMDPKENYLVEEWIKQGVIGKVTELHRWTNRPMWPQGSPYLPSNTPPIPEGFDWDLWLGPALPRPYSPDYTHTVFRGWYEFGGGCLADMGYYGLWIDWRVLNLGMPLVAEASTSFTCQVKDYRSLWVKNNLSYPHAATLRWEVPVKGTNESINVFWYEGGIRPITSKALRAKGGTIPEEGVMFVGEKGSIIAGYNYQKPELLGIENSDAIISSIKEPEVKLIDSITEMIDYFRGGKVSRGNYLNCQTIAETICLGNLAVRMNQRLEWDNKNLKVTNVPEANEYVTRKYRDGWEL
jgi:predicted dehydrogenase